MRILSPSAVFLMLCAGCARTPASSADATPASTQVGSPTAAAETSRRNADPVPQDRGEAPPTAASPSPAPSTADAALAGSSWRPTATAGAAPSSPDSGPRLTFDSLEHVSGSTGCNRFSGTVAIAGSSIRIGPLATTRRGCPPSVMEQESGFLKALEASRSWRRAGEGLELLDESGAVLLRLSSADGAPR